MTLLRSLYYALLGAVPGILSGFVVAAVLLSLSIVNPDTYLIASAEFIAQNRALFPYLELVGQYYSLLAIVASILYVFVWVKLTRFLNPNFSAYYFKVNDIGKARIALGLAVSLIGISAIGALASMIHEIVGAILTIFLFWLLWHQNGIWGNLFPFSKEKQKRTSLFRLARTTEDRHLVSVSFHAAGFLAVSILSIGLSLASANIFISTQLSSDRVFPLLIIAAFTLNGAIILPLAYAFADIRLSWQSLIVRLIVPLLITAGTIAIPASFFAFLKKTDSLRSIHSAANLDTDDSVIQRVISFEVEGQRAYFYPIASIEDSADRTFFDLATRTEPVSLPAPPCSSDNMKKLSNLLSLDSTSPLVINASFALQRCYIERWDLEQLLRARYRHFSTTANMITGIHLINRRKATAQENPLHIRYLQILMSDIFTSISAEGRKKIQETFDHYSSASKTRGYISGRVFLEHTPTPRATVGLLMNQFSKEETEQGLYNYGEYLEKPVEKYLVASTKTDQYGRFFFPALREGSYILAVIIPDMLAGAVEDIHPLATQEIREIVIEGQQASRNLGTIAIFSKDTLPQDGVIRYQLDVDTDGDELSDEEEKYYGTDPKVIDTDKDGFSDYNELNSGYDPLRPKVKYYPK